MERVPDANKPPDRIEPDKLDLSDRLPDEPATVEDLVTLRNEINYKLALLLNLQIKSIEDAPATRDLLTWQHKLELAGDIGYPNFIDFLQWMHAQERAKDPPPRRRPDQGAW
jgi:hypothetical protein